jgi:hypothetical protein
VRGDAVMIYITHHAALRAIERVLGVTLPQEVKGLPDAQALDVIDWLGLADVDGVRESLRTAAAVAVDAGASEVTMGGWKYIIKGGSLVTVAPTSGTHTTPAPRKRTITPPRIPYPYRKGFRR